MALHDVSRDLDRRLLTVPAWGGWPAWWGRAGAVEVAAADPATAHRLVVGHPASL